MKRISAFLLIALLLAPTTARAEELPQTGSDDIWFSGGQEPYEVGAYLSRKEIEKRKELNDEVVNATSFLEDVLLDQYEAEKNAIKKKIAKDGMDETLSEESMLEKDDPFKDADYMGLIASYITLTDTNTSIYAMDFFDTSYDTKEATQIKPYKYSVYSAADDGKITKESINYLTEEGDIPIYEKKEDGTYEMTGMEHIVPEEESVEYYDITIHLVSPEELLKVHHADSDEKIAEYHKRYEAIKQSGVSQEGLRQSIMLAPTSTTLSQEAQDALTMALNDENPNRSALIATASQLVGRIPYEWGGKPTKQGYDTTWGTFDENSQRRGLDCSGFVSWTYWTSGYANYGSILSTSSIRANTIHISKDELKVGDIGLLNNGETVNHTGLYVGNGYWIHCSDNGVVINKFNFPYYRRIKDFDACTFTSYVLNPLETAAVQYTPEERELLAKLVTHEARGQGWNGWVAVAEVVVNRVKSDQFPNTIQAVIDSPGQFAKREEVDLMQVPDGIYRAVDAVLMGTADVFNENPGVLFFRNPYEKDMEDWGDYKAYMRINDHVFYLGKGYSA